MDALHEGAAIGQRGQRVGLRQIGESLVDARHARRMPPRRLDIGDHRAGQDQAGDQNKPGPVMRRQERPVRHRHRDHRQPALAVGDEVA
ncbi:MAG: hypothetical protein WB774_03085 [Xanthobacteraceae bacterium]